MSTSCRKVRKELTSHNLETRVRDHLESCAACRRYAERLEAARQGLRDHHVRFEPDPSFAARVSAHCSREPGELLGQAALRLLPAGLALLIVLIWVSSMSLSPTPDEGLALTTPTDDPIAWLLEQPEDQS